MSIPFTDAELDEFRPLFKCLKSYDPIDDTIQSVDFTEAARLIRYERTEEQMEGYKVFFDKHHEGKVTKKLIT